MKKSGKLGWIAARKSNQFHGIWNQLARMVYFMLTRGEAFVDRGQQHYEEQQRQRAIAALRRRATALGFQIPPAAQLA